MTTPTWPTILDGARYADGRPVQPHTLKAIGEIVESASRLPFRWRGQPYYGRIRARIPGGEKGEHVECCPVGAAVRSGRIPLPPDLSSFLYIPNISTTDRWPAPWGRAARLVILAADSWLSGAAHDSVVRRTRQLLERRLLERSMDAETMPRLP